MPASGEGSGARSHRKGHYSCDFCRSRKLRCDRPLPCANCVTRGKTCRFAPGAAGGQSNSRTPTASDSIHHHHQQQRPEQQQPEQPEQRQPEQQQPGQRRQQLVSTDALSPPRTSPQPAAAAPDQDGLLAEVRTLRKLAQDLEKRIIQSTGHQRGSHGAEFSPPASTASPDPHYTPSSAGLSLVSDVVAHLERVSMCQSSLEPVYVEGLVFKVERIGAIAWEPWYTPPLGKPTRCVWLPRHDEARVLLDKFVTSISYIHHVVHHPSLPATIDDVYRQISGQAPIKPGHLVLLLSIVASAAHMWTPGDDVDGEGALFSSSSQANAQTPLWIKATYDALSTGQNCPAPALETVQGIIILSFLVYNLEGVSLRYRSLISTGLLLSRELGLHRIDHESNAGTANTIRAEMGRRVWWYLVATDWLLAARYGGPGEGVYQANPHHMTVRKPRNIDDADLLDDVFQLDVPISRPTEMSYFLQRIRLAEISRIIVDHNPMALFGSSGGPSYYAHVMAMDVELDRMIHDIPPFFHLDSYEHSNPDAGTSGIFVQAYMLNSIMHTQRCKLHLTYLTSGPGNDNPAYTSSRETCLKAARQIIRAETQLERARHPFVQIRLRLSAILYGVFMARIVLLMDACVHGRALQDEMRYGDVAEALRIIEDARSHSLAAANLHESLTQVLAKHRAQQKQQQASQAPRPLQSGSTPAAAAAASAASSSIFTATAPMQQRPDQVVLAMNPTQRIVSIDLDRGAHMGESPPDQPPVARSQPPYSNQLAQSLEELMDLDSFQWDDLFSGIDSSSFF